MVRTRSPAVIGLLLAGLALDAAFSMPGLLAPKAILGTPGQSQAQASGSATSGFLLGRGRSRRGRYLGGLALDAMTKKAGSDLDKSRTALQAAPNDYNTLLAHGYTCYTYLKSDEALACYNKAIQLAPARPEAYLKRAEMYDIQGERERADQDRATADKVSKWK
jgi:tetratricopeptide (TPR) repeat protein